jgi:hypothetical protein
MEEQIIEILKQHEAGVKTADLCREHGISMATFYRWKSKFGGAEVSEAARETDESAVDAMRSASRSLHFWDLEQKIAAVKRLESVINDGFDQRERGWEAESKRSLRRLTECRRAAQLLAKR